MFSIQTFSLTKYYSKGKIKALEDFNINVTRGTIFSLLGPNAAGKTTLIKTLLGIVHPTRGKATLLGENISNFRIHKKIGYLPENHRFPEFLNALQLLHIYGKMSGTKSSILKVRIPELLATVNLTEWSKTKIRKYSKGMLQRLGIAQALINDPELLFLDEPTDGIDPVGRREIRDLLVSLKAEGKTIFLNSHLLSEVERISDEIAILKNGHLIKHGNVQDFISLKDQYELHIKNEHSYIFNIFERMKIKFQQQDNRYIINVDNMLHLNNLIDELRNNQIIIQGLIPRKITLEDYFIDVIEEEGDR